MAGAKTASRKSESQRVRRLDGKEVKPVLYNGRNIGHGKYLAASIDGELVLDESGKPFPFHETGALERE